MSERDDTIRGLRALADFLEGRPDLPVPWQVRAAVGINAGSDDQQRAEVERIAMALGTRARWTSERRTHYEAERSFGGEVTYAALAITSAHMEAYREHMDSFDHGAGAAESTEGERTAANPACPRCSARDPNICSCLDRCGHEFCAGGI